MQNDAMAAHPVTRDTHESAGMQLVLHCIAVRRWERPIACFALDSTGCILLVCMKMEERSIKPTYRRNVMLHLLRILGNPVGLYHHKIGTPL